MCNPQEEGCNTILNLIPSEITDVVDCTCEIGVDGLLSIDLDATASCPIDIAGETCNVIASGSGGAIDLALGGGSGALSFGADCMLPIGNLVFSVEGEFSTDMVSIDDVCTLSVDAGDNTIDCTCSGVGECGEGPLSATVSCSGDVEVSEQCVNLAGLPEFLETNLVLPPPPLRN